MMLDNDDEDDHDSIVMVMVVSMAMMVRTIVVLMTMTVMLVRGLTGLTLFERHKAWVAFRETRSADMQPVGILCQPLERQSLDQEELKVARKLKHPNIVQLHASYETGDNYYLVMEYCSLLSADLAGLISLFNLRPCQVPV